MHQCLEIFFHVLWNVLRSVQWKKDDNLLKGNFRPVSILTSISKIYENVLYNQLLGPFYAIFNNFLSAFRKGHSCKSLLLKFVEDMKNALDQKHAVVRYIWIFPRHSIACHTACWWQSCMHTDYPPPPAAYSVIICVGTGRGSKYSTP